ncbi:hypothetical protein PoB_000130900 [Plakobranchus ocellatus]|uniref:Uncharacterized protein n=1 Tax=Plakobranchus ocellatus TaxID=259542 RepID=A0AAV3XVB0_9GAST|nr:hypothetical protein PoB_000130900 [Plakobranchus ocellatus]
MHLKFNPSKQDSTMVLTRLGSLTKTFKNHESLYGSPRQSGENDRLEVEALILNNAHTDQLMALGAHFILGDGKMLTNGSLHLIQDPTVPSAGIRHNDARERPAAVAIQERRAHSGFSLSKTNRALISNMDTEPGIRLSGHDNKTLTTRLSGESAQGASINGVASWGTRVHNRTGGKAGLVEAIRAEAAAAVGDDCDKNEKMKRKEEMPKDKQKENEKEEKKKEKQNEGTTVKEGRRRE